MQQTHEKENFLRSFLKTCVERRAIKECSLTFYLIRKWKAQDPDFKAKYEEVQAKIRDVKRCWGCGHVGPRDDFRTEKGSRFFHLSGVCRSCDSKRIIKKNRRSMEVKLNELLKRTKARRRPGGRNWPHENTLTLEFLLALLEKQGGKCYFTGVALEHDTDDKSKLVSIDRLEPGLGYVEGNVALVSWLVNQVKRDMKEEEFRSLCGKISPYRG